MAHPVSRLLGQKVAAGLLLGTLLLAGCGPEATRQRGQPGADIGNRDPNEAVEFHGRTDPSYSTPQKGQAAELGAVGTSQGDITVDPDVGENEEDQ